MDDKAQNLSMPEDTIMLHRHINCEYHTSFCSPQSKQRNSRNGKKKQNKTQNKTTMIEQYNLYKSTE